MPTKVINGAGETVEVPYMNPYSDSVTLKMIEDAKNLAMAALGNLEYVSLIDNLTLEQVQSLLATLVEIREKTLAIRGTRFLNHGGVEGEQLEL